MENKRIYTARKLKPTGKDSWVMEFRHPLSKDVSGKTGKKIRKGLGTKDEIEAEKLVQQMNLLLSDDTYWQPSARLSAQDKFNVGIVNAFYDEIDNYILPNYEKIRETKIPLKTKADGYTRTLLLGATGAGKSTLVRQILGTDPQTDRFPATSTARTTVFDTEIILSNESYKCVVTFYTESETRQFIKEIVQKAMSEFYVKKEDVHVLRVFLEDKDQRFRLSYILGKPRKNAKYSKYDDLEDDADEELFSAEIKVSDQELRENEEKISRYISVIKAMTNNVIERASKVFGDLSEDDKKALEELIQAEIDEYDEDDINVLIDEILGEIKDRFKQLREDELETEKFGWPICWYHENDKEEKEEFLKSIRFFSSNNAVLFGKLLTPLVSGMRVEGPFKPAFLAETPKLVLIDGEGLGHIPDTSDSLPDKTIEKLNECEAIILVDSSQSPMLSAPSAVIKASAISGHYKKLFLCFTHFDVMTGDNLPTIDMKVSHIFASVDSQLEKLKAELGYDIKKFLSSHLYDHSYYMGNIDKDLNEPGKSRKYGFAIDEIKKLIDSLETIIYEPVSPNTIFPHYDISTLILKIQAAAIDFHKKWEGHLYGSALIPKEHFSRIKALTKRLGGADSQYDYLRPVSDFWNVIVSHVSSFLSTPDSWTPTNPSETDKSNSIDIIRQILSDKMLSYAKLNLKNNRINDWQAAYNYRGYGSSYDRASKIRAIYSNVVRIPEEKVTRETKQFLQEVMGLVISAIEDGNGDILNNGSLVKQPSKETM